MSKWQKVTKEPDASQVGEKSQCRHDGDVNPDSDTGKIYCADCNEQIGQGLVSDPEDPSVLASSEAAAKLFDSKKRAMSQQYMWVSTGLKLAELKDKIAAAAEFAQQHSENPSYPQPASDMRGFLRAEPKIGDYVGVKFEPASTTTLKRIDGSYPEFNPRWNELAELKIEITNLKSDVERILQVINAAKSSDPFT